MVSNRSHVEAGVAEPKLNLSKVAAVRGADSPLEDAMRGRAREPQKYL
jgi:hypothetical protein